MDAGFLWLFKWLNWLLWVIGFILLFAYDILLSSIHTETGIFPILTTFLILLFRKHRHSRSINIGILIFGFLQASADGLVNDLSLYLSIWVLLIFMIWYENLRDEVDLLKQEVAYSIKLVDIQSLQDQDRQGEFLNAWSFRLSIILWLLIGSLIFFSYLMTQRDLIFDDQVRHLMLRMLRSKDDWFLLYQSEMIQLILLFVFVWYLIFQSVLDQKIDADDVDNISSGDMVGWRMFLNLILGIAFLLLSL